MLRIILAAAATFAVTAGTAGAQGLVPGAAAVEGYHERFVNDASPERLPPPAGTLVEQQLQLQAAEPDFGPPVTGIDQTVVMRPVPAAIPPAAMVVDEPHVPSSAGLTPGAPLGSDGVSDGKAVAGERR